MKEFDKLVNIIARLRQKDGGCPWDIKQTHESLLPNFIEELYEAVEAVDNKDYDHLAEELGDLLLHIVMQAQIAGEEQKFSIVNVLEKINDKLVLRHPHVFADGYATDANGVKMNWERIKFEEKKKTRQSAIDGIPRAMPALIVAQRMQEKAASVGFDWQEAEPAAAKLQEEIEEFIEAFQQKNEEEMQNELGDMLFSIVNIARKLGFDTESALRRTIDKFDRRFRQVEAHYRKTGANMLDASLEQLDEIWDLTKKNE